ncbi:DUF2634 domain-containing protein [Clostridium sp. JN-9]|nr:DUF2634 domain-containing protein [Clostridium sp. JN-9]
MSILPADAKIDDITNFHSTSKEGLPLAKEYCWDFINNDLLLENGKPKIVEGIEAIKVWIWKALKTERYRYLAYSWSYGNELNELVGKGLSIEFIRSEVERYLKEALLMNNYIIDIQNVTVTIDESKLNIEFTVATIYGEANMSV